MRWYVFDPGGRIASHAGPALGTYALSRPLDRLTCVCRWPIRSPQVLLVAISAVILGIPFVITYLSFKAVMFVVASLLVYVKTLA